MTVSLTSIKIATQIAATLQNTIDGALETAVVSQGMTLQADPTLATGTLANQADRIWQDRGRTLSVSSSENIDLFDLAAIDIGAGAGKDALGQPLSLAEIVAVVVHNDKSSTGHMLVGGEGSAAAWSSPFNGSDTSVIGPIGPGGSVTLFNPPDPAFDVTDVSNHLLKIAADSGGGITYDIVILGRSA